MFGIVCRWIGAACMAVCMSTFAAEAPEQNSSAPPLPSEAPVEAVEPIEPLAPPAEITPTSEVAPPVVTAPRFATRVAAAPVNVTVITAEDLRTSAATTLSEALQQLAGVRVQELYGTPGPGTAVDLSGFGSTGTLNTLVLLNGRRINEIDLSGTNLSAIALNSIARIEIMRGSSSVLYGDNATGGVINIVTRSGFDTTSSNATLRGGAFGAQELGASLRTHGANIGLFFGANDVRADGYRDHNEAHNTTLSSELAYQRDANTYGMRINANRDNAQLPGILTEDVYRANRTRVGNTIGQAKQTQSSMELFMEHPSFAGELALRAKNQDAQFSAGSNEAVTGTDLLTLSFTPRLSWGNEAQSIVGGIDIYRSALDTDADFGASSKYRSAATHTSYAVYVSDTYKIVETVLLNFGARYQLAKLKVDTTDVSNNTNTSDDATDALWIWDAALRLNYAENAHGYLRVANSFRFPALDEIWNYFSGQITPVEPQKGRHSEAGLAFSISQDTHVDIHMFHIKLSNEIGFDSVSSSQVNLDPTQHDGIDFGLRTRFAPWWAFQFNRSYRDTAFRSGPNQGAALPEIPPHHMTVNNQFSFADLGTLLVEFRYVGQRYFGNDYSNAGKQMPSYRWLNLGYRHAWGRLHILMTINNATDVKTADTGYYDGGYNYYPLPTRSFALGLETSF